MLQICCHKATNCLEQAESSPLPPIHPPKDPRISTTAQGHRKEIHHREPSNPNVPEYVPPLDEEGLWKMIVELIVAFDEVISLGHKENVVLGQMKQYVEMESPEERLHKLVIESKISDPKDLMKRKASEIDDNRLFCQKTGQPCDTLLTSRLQF
ncbi:unnamed protein product [Sphagnum troendelagicum]|uniref:Coatomer subunit delta n=1 Tax=Sphagnum troendelagicum TaxID=128251 RepID=A0ABP0UW48_9BRYO